MGQTSGIKVLGPGQRCLEAAAVCTFIAHGPADNGGTVLISLDTALGAVHGCFHEIGVICKGFIPGLYMILPDVVFLAVQGGSAVAFVVSLIDDQEARYKALTALDDYRLQMLKGQNDAILSIDTGFGGLDSFLKALLMFLENSVSFSGKLF